MHLKIVRKLLLSRRTLIGLAAVIVLLGLWGAFHVGTRIAMHSVRYAIRDADYQYVNRTLTWMPWLLRMNGDCDDTLLYVAVESQNPTMINLLLQRGADEEPAVAVFWDDDVALSQYISNDADVVSATWGCDAYTLLHMAAKFGSMRSARSLLAAGASVDVLCNHGWTPLRYAVFRANDEVADALIESGAASDVWIDAGRGDLRAVSARLDIAPHLLNAQDGNGLTALHWASHRCQFQVAELLLRSGADPNLRTDYVVGTPLMLAEKAGCDDAFKLLIQEFGGQLE